METDFDRVTKITVSCARIFCEYFRSQNLESRKMLLEFLFRTFFYLNFFFVVVTFHVELIERFARHGAILSVAAGTEARED